MIYIPETALVSQLWSKINKPDTLMLMTPHTGILKTSQDEAELLLYNELVDDENYELPFE